MTLNRLSPLTFAGIRGMSKNLKSSMIVFKNLKAERMTLNSEDDKLKLKISEINVFLENKCKFQSATVKKWHLRHWMNLLLM